jgi:hypothetical protein
MGTKKINMMERNNGRNNVNLVALKQITLEEYAARLFWWERGRKD